MNHKTIASKIRNPPKAAVQWASGPVNGEALAAARKGTTDAKRGDIKMKKDKIVVKGVLLGDMQTKMASLVRLANHVPLANMLRSH